MNNVLREAKNLIKKTARLIIVSAMVITYIPTIKVTVKADNDSTWADIKEEFKGYYASIEDAEWYIIEDNKYEDRSGFLIISDVTQIEEDEGLLLVKMYEENDPSEIHNIKFKRGDAGTSPAIVSSDVEHHRINKEDLPLVTEIYSKIKGEYSNEDLGNATIEMQGEKVIFNNENTGPNPLKRAIKDNDSYVTFVFGFPLTISMDSDKASMLSFVGYSFLPVAHTHHWVYVAKESVLKTYCDETEAKFNCNYQANEDDLTNAINLTLTVSEINYSGSEATITIGSEDERTAWIDAGLELPTDITYESSEGVHLNEAPTTTGSYIAKVSPVGETPTIQNTAKVSFTIIATTPEPEPTPTPEPETPSSSPRPGYRAPNTGVSGASTTILNNGFIELGTIAAGSMIGLISNKKRKH